LYKNISHWIRWELIDCCTSTQFWFRVKVCWFLLIVSTVRHMIWYSFWNVVIHQNISMSVAVTASNMIMLLAVSYATMTFSLSSQTMRTTTVSMRMNMLLNQGKSHQHCWWGQLSSTSLLRYIQLFFLLCTVLV